MFQSEKRKRMYNVYIQTKRKDTFTDKEKSEPSPLTNPNAVEYEDCSM